MLKQYEIVKIIDLDPIITKVKDSEPWIYRIEIHRDLNRRRYGARVYRKEYFRLKTAFPSNGPGLRSYNCFFVEDIADWHKLTGKTANEVLNKVLKKIKTAFVHTGRSPRGKH